MTRGAQRFTAGKKVVTLEQVKGTLLAVADQMLSTVSEIIVENAQHDKGGKQCWPLIMGLLIFVSMEINVQFFGWKLVGFHLN